MINSLSRSPEVSHNEWPEVWQAACRLLEGKIVNEQMQTWIHPLEMRRTESTAAGLRFHLAAQNDFSAQWVRDNFKKTIETTLAQVTGSPCEIQLSVLESAEVPMAPVAAQAELPSGTRNFASPVETPVSPLAVPFASPAAAPRLSPSGKVDYFLDTRYMFANFVVGASNQFAHAAAVAVAEQPGRQYNPLFLYSPPGLGKTHLLHAIGNHLLSRNPNARVAYFSAEKFVNELIDSIQHHRMPQFRQKYRESYDMILIDDIQFIAGKSTSEEEFFHTFNALYGSQRQIVVTSDRPPKEIEGLEERVRTRFQCGLVADICPPEIETRIAILKAKAERDDIYLPDDVSTFLASCIKSNVRELEGVLIRLQAQASLSGAEISLEMAKQELRAAVPEEGSRFTIEAIQNAVAKHFRIKVQDLKSSSRSKSVSEPRHIAMYLIRKYVGLGFKEIGQYFGGKDHSTVVHACQKIEDELESSGELRSAVEAIQNLL